LKNRPLEGRGIVITRPAGQAGELASLIEAQGARALRFPAIEIQDVPGWQLPELEGFDLAVFVSPSAVHKVFERIEKWPQRPRAAAVGGGTRRELERRGAGEVLAPEAGGDSEALLALPPMQDMAGKRIVIFRGEGGRELLGETLSARGAQVTYAECYRRVRPQADSGPLLEAWQRGEVHAVTVSSAQGLDNLVELLGAAGRPHLARTPLFATHERIAQHAKQHAIAEVLVGGPGDAELTARLVAYFGPRMSEETATPRRSKVPVLLLVAIVLAAALAAVFWLDARQRIDATQQELARRLRDIENDAREARSAARQAQEGLRDAQGKLGQLEARVAESQSQQGALEALYQDLSRNRDEWQLAEIEQVLTIASQQLQLAGNVRAALLALQLADARLARAEQPQFQPIRRALARDIERLKALPGVDLAGMSMRLDRLVAQVDALPLAFDERAERIGAAKEAAAPAGERGFWSRLGAEVWGELRELVVVRKLDDPAPPLLPPSQAYFLRENLRLRLLNARLTLLTRDETGYREDLRAAQAWIERYFDRQSKQTADALGELKELSSATLSFEMPAISESLEAVRGFKARRERTP
jgi:uncharacterized protein HemX/uroporphyrinogen-III synthase